MACPSALPKTSPRPTQNAWRDLKIPAASKSAHLASLKACFTRSGYPGNLRVTAAFTLSTDNTLTIDYRAETDRTTIVNITHHGYFNLGGEAGGAVRDHRLTLKADAFTPIDAVSIPTGEVRKVLGTAFNFRKATRIGDALLSSRDEQLQFGEGYDHNFVVDGPPSMLRTAALLTEPSSGRAMELLTTAPGLQFYSGNFLDGAHAQQKRNALSQQGGLCLEPQFFPNSPNQPAFPSAVLHPGEAFHNRIVLKFFVTESFDEQLS